MEDDQIKAECIENEDDSIKNALAPIDIEILVTDEDKTGTDIIAMSDFFDGYITKLSTSLMDDSVFERIVNIPASDFGILNDVIKYAEISLQNDFSCLLESDGVRTSTPLTSPFL